MKLATLDDGSRDGLLAVVSRDLQRAHFAAGIAGTLQQVLDDWNFRSPPLQDLYTALNAGQARHAFEFDPRRCLPPLPRAACCVDAAVPAAAQAPQQAGLPGFDDGGTGGSASAPTPAPAPGRRGRVAAPPPRWTCLPGNALLGAQAPVPLLPGETALWPPPASSSLPSRPGGRRPGAVRVGARPWLAAVTADMAARTAAEDTAQGIRLLLLGAAWWAGDAAGGSDGGDTAPAFAVSVAPVAVTPDELGPRWRHGQAALALRQEDREAGALAVAFGPLLAALTERRPLRAGSVAGIGIGVGEGADAAGRLVVDAPPGADARLRLAAFDDDGHSLFGAVDAPLRPARPAPDADGPGAADDGRGGGPRWAR